MSIHTSAYLLGLAAMLPTSGLNCQSLLPHEERGVSSYEVAVRARTGDWTPVPGVLISSPDSGTRGITNAQGQLTFRINGLEGTAVSFHVERAPDGIVEVDDSAAHRMILKTIVGRKPAGGQKSEVLTYDILMRRSREMYVVLVSTSGVADLPISANGVELGKLNSLGAGAFRIKGQPGEELKVVIQTAKSPLVLTQENPERTFLLPPTSSILSFSSTLALVPKSPDQSAGKAIITFVPKSTKHPHRRHPPSAPTAAEPAKAAGPIQVPFRGVAVK